MSQHIYRHGTTEVLMGYDRPLDYVFCVVERDGEPIYSNLDDRYAGTECQSVEYYRAVLRNLGVEVPEALFTETARDQFEQVGNRRVDHTPPEEKS